METIKTTVSYILVIEIIAVLAIIILYLIPKYALPWTEKNIAPLVRRIFNILLLLIIGFIGLYILVRLIHLFWITDLTSIVNYIQTY